MNKLYNPWKIKFSSSSSSSSSDLCDPFVSHFNVSLIVRDKVTRQCSQTTLKGKGEPKRTQAEVLAAYQPDAFDHTAHFIRIIISFLFLRNLYCMRPQNTL